jgi:hypothetical protein
LREQLGLKSKPRRRRGIRLLPSRNGRKTSPRASPLIRCGWESRETGVRS